MGINSSSISYGVKDVRIAKADPFLNQFAPALTQSNSIGFRADTSIKKESEPVKRTVCKGGRLYEVTVGYKRETILVETSIKEFSPSNIGLLLGRANDISTNHTIIAKEFPLVFAGTSSFRIEIICGYVNKTNYMTFIIPTASLSSDLEFLFSDGNYLTQPLKFRSIPLNNATWNSNPIGRMFTS